MLVNKDTYKHKDTEVWQILRGKLGGEARNVAPPPWRRH